MTRSDLRPAGRCDRIDPSETSMPRGHLLLVLHAHLPFIRHPDNDDFLEEDWLFEAITETYIPLLHNLQQAMEAGVQPRLTMTWSPPLCEMLADPLLQDRYRRHVSRLLELAEQEVPAKAGTPFAEAAVMYRDHYRFCLTTLDRYDDNLLGWVRHLMNAGVLEPITCGATHGFLPLMRHREAQRAQIAVAVENYRKHFGRPPRGIWLPECGFAPGIDELLREQDIRFFFVETHGIYFGEPRPRFGVYRPIYTPAGVAAFGRDPESSRSVWSAESGYPGNPVYREFYRDLGYDGDYDYVRNFLHGDGIRRNLGLKYHRVTGKVALHEKEPYSPRQAYHQAMEDAGNFVYNRMQQVRFLGDLLETEPVLVAPYDAELFGHWWFEGPQFIQSIFHTLHQAPEMDAVTASGYLEDCSVHQICMPSASSWGDNGYNGVWLNPGNDWIYRHLHMAEERMIDCARRFPEADGDLRRALNQMARELLLMQSSDWAFIMTTQT
ncbi:MAG: glycoside hydrolase family 57 protein, partial [Planctomycetota bacterium]